MNTRTAASPAATPASIGTRSDCSISYSSGSCAMAAFGGGEKPGEVVRHGGEPGRHLLIAPASLKQLVGDSEPREDGGLVRLHHRQAVPHPLQCRVEIRRDLTGVLGRYFGADGIFLTA